MAFYQRTTTPSLAQQQRLLAPHNTKGYLKGTILQESLTENHWLERFIIHSVGWISM